MPRGGARTNSGPAPDPEALRRERPSDKDGWTVLPREGRTAPAPMFPLVSPTPREYEMWDEVWEKPQAIMWEELGQELEVAFFVRKLVEAEQPKASVELRKSIRQDFDSLGLSVQGMLRNRWKITEDAKDKPEETQDKPGGRKSSRDRMRVVKDAG